MRGTLHLPAAEDLAWMVGLLGPVAMAASRSRLEQLGPDTATVAQGRSASNMLFASEPAPTRDALTKSLTRQGVRLAGHTLYHFLRHMARAVVYTPKAQVKAQPCGGVHTRLAFALTPSARLTLAGACVTCPVLHEHGPLLRNLP